MVAGHLALDMAKRNVRNLGICFEEGTFSRSCNSTRCVCEEIWNCQVPGSWGRAGGYLCFSLGTGNQWENRDPDPLLVMPEDAGAAT